MVPLILYRLSLCYHSCFLSIPPDIILSPPVPGSFPSPSAPIVPRFFPPGCCLFIGALHSTHHVSLPPFYPSSCRSLNPLSFAPLCPHPSRFSSSSLRVVFHAVPFPPTLFSSPFISSCLSVPFIPPHLFVPRNITISLCLIALPHFSQLYYH